MKLTRISQNFTPLHEGILFGIDSESEEPANLEVEIVEVVTGKVVATKLLRNTIATTINIAPYIEFSTEYAPTSTAQTTFAEAPTASYKICIGNIFSEEVVVSVNRCRTDSKPSIVAALPSARQIARTENDEVLIIAEKGQTLYAEIEADTGESLHLEYQTSSGAAILSFCPNDFDMTMRTLSISLYCEGEKFGSLRYTVGSPLKTATRMAWLSDSGAIERYSFIIAKTKCSKIQNQTRLFDLKGQSKRNATRI